jgi:hypothetical protein
VENAVTLKAVWSRPNACLAGCQPECMATCVAGSSNGGAPIDGYLVEWYSQPWTKEVQTVTVSAGAGVTEVQQVESTASANNLAGFFRLRFNGETTEDIPFDASNTEVQAKLQRLSTIGRVTVGARAESKVPLPGNVYVANGEEYLYVDAQWTAADFPQTARSWTSADGNTDYEGIQGWVEGNEFCIDTSALKGRPQ